MEDRAISLNAVINTLSNCFDSEYAIWSVKQLPPVTPNEEEMAIKYIEGYNTGFCHAQAIFQKEQLKGHWIESEFDMSVYCSECNSEYEWMYDFCPDCGARMVEPQESEE